MTEVTILSGPEVFRDSVAEALHRYRCTDAAAPFVARQTFSFRLAGPGLPAAEDTSLPAFLAGVPDVDSIRRTDDRVLLRMLFRNPQGVVFDGRTYRSGAMVMALDCRQRRYRNVTTVLHTGLDTDGEAAASTRLDGPIAQLGDSAEERRFMALACDASADGADGAAAVPALPATEPVRMLAVRPDRRYGALDAAERDRVRARYESLAAEETSRPTRPPDCARCARRWPRRSAACTRAACWSSPRRSTRPATATTVTVAESPNAAMADFATAALKQLQFKPATCGGLACAMPFPLQVEFPAR